MHGVLSDVGVEHQQHFVRPRIVGLLDYPADLGDFFHQVQLRRQASRGIRQDDIDPARTGGIDGIEHHGGRVAGLLGDHGDAVPFAPGGQLLAGRGAEGVAGGEQDALALALEMLGQLADRGGLAGTVDPGDHDHEGLVAAGIHGLLQWCQQCLQSPGQCGAQLRRRLQLVALDAGLEFGQQPLRGFDTAIRHQQRRLQVVQQLVVDLRPAEQFGQRRIKGFAGAREAGLEAFAP